MCFFSSFFLGFLCAVHSSRFGGSRNLLFSENCVLKIAVWSTLGWLATCPCPSTTTRRQTPAFQTTLREKEGGNPSRPFVTSCPAEDLLLAVTRASNLGIVFCPTLLRTSEGLVSLDTVHQTKVIELLIEHVDSIFGPPLEPSSSSVVVVAATALPNSSSSSPAL